MHPGRNLRITTHGVDLTQFAGVSLISSSLSALDCALPWHGTLLVILTPIEDWLGSPVGFSGLAGCET